MAQVSTVQAKLSLTYSSKRGPKGESVDHENSCKAGARGARIIEPSKAKSYTRRKRFTICPDVQAQFQIVQVGGSRSETARSSGTQGQDRYRRQFMSKRTL